MMFVAVLGIDDEQLGERLLIETAQGGVPRAGHGSSGPPRD